MFCSQCGRENKEEAKFCAGCGTALKNGVNTYKTSKISLKKGKSIKIIISFLTLIIVVVTAVYISNITVVVFEDPLIERCVRKTLGKGENDNISKKECKDIKSLVINCELDTSFSMNDVFSQPIVSNYVDLKDLQFLTGLEELYIDNKCNEDYLANFDTIAKCKKLRKLSVQYNPAIVFYNGEIGKGYKYIAEVVKQLPKLEFLDLGHFVISKYKDVISAQNKDLEIYDGYDSSYLKEENKWLVNDEIRNQFITKSVDEYVKNWTYKYNGHEPIKNSNYDGKNKACLEVATIMELEQIIEQLAIDTEDIYISIALDGEIKEIDLGFFDKFNNLKTLSVWGVGCIGTVFEEETGFSEIKFKEGTKITGIETLHKHEELFSINFYGCSADFSELDNVKNLKEISIIACYIENPDFLGKVKELRELTLIANKCESLENYLEKNYKQFEKLKFLKTATKNWFYGIEKCPELETLIVTDFDTVHVETLENIAKCRTLKGIVINNGGDWNNQIDVLPLVNLTELETLFIREGDVINMDSLFELSNLHTIVTGFFVDDNGDGSYVEELNRLYEMAVKNKKISFFNPVSSKTIYERIWRDEFQKIEFSRLYDADIYDGLIQYLLCTDRINQYMSFEDAYNRFYLENF